MSLIVAKYMYTEALLKSTLWPKGSSRDSDWEDKKLTLHTWSLQEGSSVITKEILRRIPHPDIHDLSIPVPSAILDEVGELRLQLRADVLRRDR